MKSRHAKDRSTNAAGAPKWKMKMQNTQDEESQQQSSKRAKMSSLFEQQFQLQIHNTKDYNQADIVFLAEIFEGYLNEGDIIELTCSSSSNVGANSGGSGAGGGSFTGGSQSQAGSLSRMSTLSNNSLKESKKKLVIRF